MAPKSESGFFNSHDPQVLETRSGGGLSAFFGAIIFLVGALIFLSGLELIPIQMQGGLGALAFLGLLLGLGGLALMLGRAGIVLDQRTGTAVKWWGLIKPIKRKEYPLEAFSQVTMNKEVRGSGKNRRTVYPVRLWGEATASFELRAPLQYETGRAVAEELAKFLGKPLVDYSSGVAVVRQAAELDLSIREQARLTRESVDAVPAPAVLRTAIEDRGGEIVLTFPRSGLKPLHIAQLFAAMVFGGFILAPTLPAALMLRTNGGLAMAALAILLAFLPLALVSLGVGASARGRTRVTASIQTLTMEKKGAFGRKTTVIPAEKLEELVLLDLVPPPGSPPPPLFAATPDGNAQSPGFPPGQQVSQFILSLIGISGSKGIAARSDQATALFGQGLDPVEVRYLHAIIKRTLTS